MNPADVKALVTTIAIEWGYKPPLVEVKHLRRWLALCNSGQKRICIDIDICRANSVEDISKIIKHELAHFKEMTHSRAFAAELERMGLKTYARIVRNGKDYYEVGDYKDPRRS